MRRGKVPTALNRCPAMNCHNSDWLPARRARIPAKFTSHRAVSYRCSETQTCVQNYFEIEEIISYWGIQNTKGRYPEACSSQSLAAQGHGRQGRWYEVSKTLNSHKYMFIIPQTSVFTVASISVWEPLSSYLLALAMLVKVKPYLPHPHGPQRNPIYHTIKPSWKLKHTTTAQILLGLGPAIGKQ